MPTCGSGSKEILQTISSHTFTVETKGIIRTLKSVVGRHKLQRETCQLPGSVFLYDDGTVYRELQHPKEAGIKGKACKSGIVRGESV